MHLCYTNIHTLIKACKTRQVLPELHTRSGRSPSSPSFLTQSQWGFSHMCLDTPILTPQI